MPYIIEGGCCQICKEYLCQRIYKEFDFLLFNTTKNKRVDL